MPDESALAELRLPDGKTVTLTMEGREYVFNGGAMIAGINVNNVGATVDAEILASPRAVLSFVGQLLGELAHSSGQPLQVVALHAAAYAQNCMGGETRMPVQPGMASPQMMLSRGAAEA